MKQIKLILIIITGTLFSSCNSTSPNDYFNKAALNSNLVTAYYKPNFFREILELKNQDRLIIYQGNKNQPATAEEYLKFRLPDLDKNLSEIKALKKTDETRDMLEASIAYFEHANGVFKNDYPKIAKMIDANRPQSEIQQEVEKVFASNDKQIFEKSERLRTTAEAYAAKNGIAVKRVGS